MNVYRYERKFLTTLFPYEAEQVILDNPAHFNKLYEPRWINNIYLDTPGLTYYYDNVEGEKSRLKVRVRWYGPEKKRAVKPVLEFKIKRGFFGEKRSYPLPDFDVDGVDLRKTLNQTFRSAYLPPNVLDILEGLNPMIFNRYLRSYYLSSDNIFRLTLDDQLFFAGCSAGKMSFLSETEDFDVRIFELKYDVGKDTLADKISKHFPFRLTKNSKYLRGVELVCM